MYKHFSRYWRSASVPSGQIGVASVAERFASGVRQQADKQLLAIARAHGGTCAYFCAARWKDLVLQVRSGRSVLIRYTHPHTGQRSYALILGRSGRSLQLLHPSDGSCMTLSSAALKRLWLGHSTPMPDRGWMMTLVPTTNPLAR